MAYNFNIFIFQRFSYPLTACALRHYIELIPNFYSVNERKPIKQTLPTSDTDLVIQWKSQ